ncbi:hypothetical protein [Ekhidna sp.]|uniref:hypothetical protein n=1 Tax=Ekhidna sp. TaxID=2608089 RepID=UPI0032975C40
MKRGVYVLLLVMIGCSVSNQSNSDSIRIVKLNFKECGPELPYNKIELRIPEGFAQERFNDQHGFCEYRFTYLDSSILYVSSNIYYGSSLNYQNRLNAGIKTYSNNRTLSDSISNSGRDYNQKYWMELVGSNYVIGYLNYPDSVSITELFQDIMLIN